MRREMASQGDVRTSRHGSCCLSREKFLALASLLAAAWVLSTCSQRAGASQFRAMTGPVEAELKSAAPSANQERARDLRRVDRQGAVEIAVWPLDLDVQGGDLLAFEVSMNTHSVDLSMDLAPLSTLSTDAGLQVKAVSWTGGSGHHVRGLLTFPSVTSDGTPLLANGQRLVLTIRDVDAPSREFAWELPPVP